MLKVRQERKYSTVIIPMTIAVIIGKLNEAILSVGTKLTSIPSISICNVDIRALFQLCQND